MVGLLACWTGCASVERPQGVSLARDPWGHRPGPQGFRTVIIDAGHGGPDSGAVSRATGDQEKRLALDTAHRLARQLENDFRVVWVRSDDRFVDLDERVALANRHEAAILVSLHYNASPNPGVRGPETYYWRVDSHGLATRIQQGLESVIPARLGNLGLRRRRLRLTRNPEIPCVLVEFGYLSNAAEARQCAEPAYRERLAREVAEAIREQARLGDLGHRAQTATALSALEPADGSAGFLSGGDGVRASAA